MGTSIWDKAFVVNLKKKHHNIECYNCYMKGHIKLECWAKGGDKKGQAPKWKGHNSNKRSDIRDNTVTVTLVVDIKAWAAMKAWDDSFLDEEESIG